MDVDEPCHIVTGEANLTMIPPHQNQCWSLILNDVPATTSTDSLTGVPEDLHGDLTRCLQLPNEGLQGLLEWGKGQSWLTTALHTNLGLGSQAPLHPWATFLLHDGHRRCIHLSHPLHSVVIALWVQGQVYSGDTKYSTNADPTP